MLSAKDASFFVFTLVLFGAFCAFFACTSIVSAHEVYVLEKETVEHLLNGEQPNPFELIQTSAALFFFWAFIAIGVVTTVFFVSISHWFEKVFDPLFFHIKKKYAIIIGRVTLGSSLIASGYFGALFGPDLSVAELFGEQAAFFIDALLITLGIIFVFGFGTRVAALIMILFFAWAVHIKGMYMLTYANYLGEILLVLILGAHVLAVDKKVLQSHKYLNRIERFFEKYAFLILRIAFGVSLIYASVYAKILNSSLALQTVIEYNLTDYFHFEPLFIVLGAALIEITLGVFFIIGFEIRFAAVFLLVFLTLSLLYFGEAVWPHFILFGVAFALFVHGYDRYTIEGRFFKDAKHEPIL